MSECRIRKPCTACLLYTSHDRLRRFIRKYIVRKGYVESQLCGLQAVDLGKVNHRLRYCRIRSRRRDRRLRRFLRRLRSSGFRPWRSNSKRRIRIRRIIFPIAARSNPYEQADCEDVYKRQEYGRSVLYCTLMPFSELVVLLFLVPDFKEMCIRDRC